MSDEALKTLVINAELPSILSGAFFRRDLRTYDAVVVVRPGVSLADIAAGLSDHASNQQQEVQDA